MKNNELSRHFSAIYQVLNNARINIRLASLLGNNATEEQIKEVAELRSRTHDLYGKMLLENRQELVSEIQKLLDMHDRYRSNFWNPAEAVEVVGISEEGITESRKSAVLKPGWMRLDAEIDKLMNSLKPFLQQEQEPEIKRRELDDILTVGIVNKAKDKDRDLVADIKEYISAHHTKTEITAMAAFLYDKDRKCIRNRPATFSKFLHLFAEVVGVECPDTKNYKPSLPQVQEKVREIENILFYL